MTTIESKKVKVNAPAREVFDYLRNLTNLKELLPQDNISDWSATSDKCSFKIQNAYSITLEHDTEDVPNYIQLKSGEGGPLPFTLEIFLAEEGDTTQVYQVCNAEMNAFIKMMAKKPLKNLFDHIAEKLAQKF